MSFGFLPADGQPDFEALFKQFSEMGIDSETLAGAKSFIENMQSPTTANQNLINPATDIITKKGCAFLAPIDGTVDEVSRKDRWSGKSNRGQDRGGLFVSIIGSDGVRYYGSHLSEVAVGIEPGAPVGAGQELGKVGDTGSARGTSPHLHFGLSWPTEKGDWKIRRGALLPYKYLKSWQKGGNLSPVDAIKEAKSAISGP